MIKSLMLLEKENRESFHFKTLEPSVRSVLII